LTLTFKGNSSFNSNCSGTGVSSIGSTSNQIVE
jgi:hypothetical protein